MPGWATVQSKELGSSAGAALGQESTAQPRPEVENKNIQQSLTKIRADRRIGPHNKLILNIIFGSLLGDGHAERRIKGNGTRITFYQEGSHVSYLL